MGQRAHPGTAVRNFRPGGLVLAACLSLRPQHPGAALIVQQIQVAGVGVAYLDQSIQKAAQQFIQIARFQLDAEQLVEGLRFGLADLVIRVVQRQDDAEMQLLAHPLEVGVFVGEQLAQHGGEQPVILLQGFDDAAGRQIELGQAAAVVFHLLDEFQRRLAAGQNARGGARSDGSQRHADLGLELPGLKLALFQPRQEAPVQRFGVRQEKHRQAMQVDAELIAEYIGCVGQFRRYFRQWHPAFAIGD